MIIKKLFYLSILILFLNACSESDTTPPSPNYSEYVDQISLTVVSNINSLPANYPKTKEEYFNIIKGKYYVKSRNLESLKTDSSVLTPLFFDLIQERTEKKYGPNIYNKDNCLEYFEINDDSTFNYKINLINFDTASFISKRENIKTSEVNIRVKGSINIKKYNNIFYHEEKGKEYRIFSSDIEEEYLQSFIFLESVYSGSIISQRKYFLESINLDNDEIQVIEIASVHSTIKSTGKRIYCINTLILSKTK
jgi:hypothetical protein